MSMYACQLSQIFVLCLYNIYAGKFGFIIIFHDFTTLNIDS